MLTTLVQHGPARLDDLYSREPWRRADVSLRIDEADALLRVFLDGGIDNHGDGPAVRQHLTLDTLAEARLIERGPTADTLARSVTYSLLLMDELPDPQPPRDPPRRRSCGWARKCQWVGHPVGLARTAGKPAGRFRRYR
ncbi:hypothetical protein [Embleya sp. NPDC059259]|uniref:hypothetical protein n=1 Tax=unclassified Embleya TaxID=2699296 RepID=UPI0036CD66D3